MDKPFLAELLLCRTGSWIVQFLRYTIVGGTAFVVDFGLLGILTECCGLHYLLSATLSFAAGLTVNYLLSVSWVFSRSRLDNRMAEFIIFGIVGVVGLLLNNLLLYLFTDVLNLHYMVSKIISAVIVLCWNFGGRKIILFK